MVKFRRNYSYIFKKINNKIKKINFLKE